MKPPYGKYKHTSWDRVPHQYILTLLMNQDKGELVEQAIQEVKRREQATSDQTDLRYTRINDHYRRFKPLYEHLNWEKPEGVVEWDFFQKTN